MFKGIPPKAHNFDHRWFIVDPPPGIWYAPRGWRSDDQAAKPILSSSIHELREQYRDARRQLLRGGPVSLLDLLSEDRLRRAGWVLHVGESSRHAGPSTFPLQPPAPPTADVLAREGVFTPQGQSPLEGLDPSNCPPPFFGHPGFLPLLCLFIHHHFFFTDAFSQFFLLFGRHETGNTSNLLEGD